MGLRLVRAAVVTNRIEMDHVAVVNEQLSVRPVYI